MPTQPLSLVLHYLYSSLDSSTSGRSDEDLLARFTVDCDPASFEELVRRYEAMVLNVCQRQLGQGADADDAFQATFFLLARKAYSGITNSSISVVNSAECPADANSCSRSESFGATFAMLEV